MKKYLPVVLLLIVCSCSPVKGPDAVVTASFPALIKTETDYIIGLTLGDGAIMDNGQQEIDKTYRITPYNANIAARALLAEPTPAKVAVVKKWMLWYFRKLNSDGSINDHYAASPTDTAHYCTKEYDSMDSYAATFLSLAKRLGEASPDGIAWLQHNHGHLELIASSLNTCITAGGLTIAKPNYYKHYTMDNAEVNQGLRDIQWLIAHQILSAGTWQQKLQDNTNGFKSLYNTQAGLYYSSIEDKTIQWSSFYPFGTCQFFPAMYHIIDSASAQAKSLWSQFNSHYPNWSKGQVYTTDGTVWAEPAYVANIMNDNAHANLYLNYIQDYIKANAGKHPPYWNNKDAAFIILAAIGAK